jgi:hypothetical protein
MTMKILLAMLLAFADDEAAAQALRDKGAKVVVAKGAVTSVDAADVSSWTEADFRRLTTLAGLKNLSVGKGLNDAMLAILAGIPELDTLQTNEAGITDDGVQALAQMTKLKVLKFFHPGKGFTGSGLSKLGGMPNLGSLTVAGSVAFADEGMAAVGRLTNLKEFRTWHAGQTIEGVKHLRELHNLKSLTLGQRLSYDPPTSLSNETLAILSELKSLESLRLEEARLNFDALVQLKQLPALKTLQLEGIEMPAADVERLKKELPGAAVQWTKPNDAYLKRIQKLFGSN